MSPKVKTGRSHGTSGRYAEGCRCDVCTNANTERTQRGKAARTERKPEVHNASTYVNWGCRCDDCTADNQRVVDEKRRAAGRGANSGAPWTKEELAAITERIDKRRYARTALELALDLGRSVGAVNQQRSLCNLGKYTQI